MSDRIGSGLLNFENSWQNGLTGVDYNLHHKLIRGPLKGTMIFLQALSFITVVGNWNTGGCGSKVPERVANKVPDFVIWGC